MGFFSRDKEQDELKWREANSEVLRLARQGSYKEARALGEELHDFTRKVFGKEDAKAVKTANNLGYILMLSQEYDDAEAYMLMALQTAEKIFGKYEREVAMININLSRLYAFRANAIKGLDDAVSGQARNHQGEEALASSAEDEE